MPNLDIEIPDWVTAEPPNVNYDLTMFEPGGGAIDGWYFSLTRDEFIELRDHLAHIRGLGSAGA